MYSMFWTTTFTACLALTANKCARFLPKSSKTGAFLAPRVHHTAQKGTVVHLHSLCRLVFPVPAGQGRSSPFESHHIAAIWLLIVVLLNSGLAESNKSASSARLAD
jgi:hypothetical protein